MNRYFQILALAMFMVGLSFLPAKAADLPLMVGFRGDGTGRFPPDCRPPAEFDGITGQKLVWKVPLPNFSNSSPIVVGRKVFVVCDPGWPEGQDCAVLLCLDAETGKELWRREIDEFAVFSPQEAQAARDLRAEFYRRIRRLNRIMYEYQSADEAKKASLYEEARQIGEAKVDYYESGGWGTGSAEQAVSRTRDFGRRVREVCRFSPITWSPTCLGINMPTPVSDGRRVFVVTGYRQVVAFDLDGYKLWHTWQKDAPYNYHWVTDCANSPLLVDGLLLMYCWDHLWAWDTATGQLRWKAEAAAWHRHAMGTPLVLHLPNPHGGPAVKAVFCWTGDLFRLSDGKPLLRWLGKIKPASMSTDGRDRVFVDVGSGPAEGGAKVLLTDLKLLFDEADDGSLGARFHLDANGTVTVQKLWFNEKGDGYKHLHTYPIFHREKLWTVLGDVVDAATGKAIPRPKQRYNFAYHGMILADGRMYGLEKTRLNEGSGGASGLGKLKDNILYCTVVWLGEDAVEKVLRCPVEFLPATITEPAKKAQVVALTGRDRYQDWYGWHEAYSAPFASGNRLFIRTFDYLYCFGDKNQPFVPSKAFEEVK
jgi:outer membrane protein assembly factor BamB